ncbi:uncharacterized protein BT62DRAFT_1073030 [Guyanagaster necrorhizus]|uniref:G-protein coupled receptors family 1 profile domain-containing protein n=1 Tax=Guyanagaster necrorhizus TaxID=856835 RepID=A0A9P7W1D0_9AGAR|nr:uncharacterized protein BT62DRAFT_1073030 [Guyanagaster necrorhizus MCA 3950]KAG7449591.1 hypothetical protein BT62DRAFT_1073030 [Guyanagaster necrorhizus MCA 3950]
MTQRTVLDGPNVVLEMPYTSKEIHGISTLIVVSCISLVAVVGLLAVIAISAFNIRSSLDEHLFVRTHIVAYFVCLLVSDLIQAIASILNAAWVQSSGVQAGPLCTIQGALKQIADVSIAFWTLTIAVQTFFLLVFDLHLRQFILWMTLVAGWSGIFTIVLAGPATLNVHERGPYYGIAGYWCWITDAYPSERITLDYIFMFIAALGSLLLYTIIFLRLRGHIEMDGRTPKRFRLHPVKRAGDWRTTDSDNEATKIAKRMVLYPITYIIMILPITVTRFMNLAGQAVSLEAMIFSATLFLLSGAVNVVLFASTPRILPVRSMRVKKFKISLPRVLQPNARGVSDPDPYYAESESAYHRTPPVSPGPSHVLPSVLPLQIRQREAPTSPCEAHQMPIPEPVPVKQDVSSSLPRSYPSALRFPQRNGIESMYSYYDEDDVLNNYDEVSLNSSDAPAVEPLEPSSESEYSAESMILKPYMYPSSITTAC